MSEHFDQDIDQPSPNFAETIGGIFGSKKTWGIAAAIVVGIGALLKGQDLLERIPPTSANDFDAMRAAVQEAPAGVKLRLLCQKVPNNLFLIGSDFQVTQRKLNSGTFGDRFSAKAEKGAIGCELVGDPDGVANAAATLSPDLKAATLRRIGRNGPAGI